MDFPVHQISVGPDETKVISKTQVGHLRPITEKTALCLWSKANTASLVKSPFSSSMPVYYYTILTM